MRGENVPAYILKKRSLLTETAMRKFHNYPAIRKCKRFVDVVQLFSYDQDDLLEIVGRHYKLEPGVYTVEVSKGYCQGFEIIDEFTL